MSSITNQMTAIYVFVDDQLKDHPEWALARRSPNAHPRFTDAEVITLGLLQGCLGVATLKRTYQLVANNWRSAFPHLCSYAQWLERLHALTAQVGRLILPALEGFLLGDTPVYVADSKPIPVCKPIRHGRVRLLGEACAYFGKNQAGWFYGFKLHALVHTGGALVAVLLTPANWPDTRVAAFLCRWVHQGTLLGDSHYRGDALWEQLAQENELIVLTPAEGGDKRALISSVRERVETCFSQLWSRFVDRVFSRSWNGLWNTIKLKVLHYNLCWAGILPA